MENTFFGALKSSKDKRDYKWSNVAMAVEPFDWTKGYDIETIRGKFKTKDQNGSGSCGGQAWSYYAFALGNDLNEKSASFIYHQTRIPPAGSDGRSNCKLCVNTGVADENVCSSYDNGNPPSEEYMVNLKISDEAFLNAKEHKELKYAFVDNLNIDLLAQTIRENNGCVIGVVGENNGTWRTSLVKAPSSVNGWRHWLYCGKAKMINGVKYIGFKNSWGDSVGDNGWQWMTEDYFKNKWMIWEAWTMTSLPVDKFQFTKTLRFTMWGQDIKELQKRLGVIQTGFFGTLTLKAVKDFQQKNGLVVDGIVGKDTQKVLNGN